MADGKKGGTLRASQDVAKLEKTVDVLDQHEKGSRREGLPREFYTVSQLAELLQLTEMTIYRMINRGELPCYAIGRVKRFRYGDIEEFLEHCRVPAGAKDT